MALHAAGRSGGVNLDDLLPDLLILQKTQHKAPLAFHSGGIFVGTYLPERLTDNERSLLHEHGWTMKEDSWFHENP